MENKKAKIEQVEAGMLFLIEWGQYWKMLRMLVCEEVVKLVRYPL